MIGRVMVAAGAFFSIVAAGLAGLVLFVVLFVAAMTVIGAIHRWWYGRD